MPKLKVIWFDRNKLRCLNSKLLEPIMNNDLKWISFKENERINDIFFPGCSIGTVKDLMNIIDEKCDPPIEPLKEVFYEKLAKGFEGMWLSGEFSDFTIFTETKKLRVHKSILSITSSVFRKMFADENLEIQANELRIEDVSEKAVEEFLHYFYIGDISEDINATEILSLANKLGVPELKIFAENLLINESNTQIK